MQQYALQARLAKVKHDDVCMVVADIVIINVAVCSRNLRAALMQTHKAVEELYLL
jgi:hypothetical protein